MATKKNLLLSVAALFTAATLYAQTLYTDSGGSVSDAVDIAAVALTGPAVEGGGPVAMHELRPGGVGTGVFEAYLRLQPGTWTLRGTTSGGASLLLGQGAEAGTVAVDGAAFVAEAEQVVRVRLESKKGTVAVTPVELCVKGNIAPAGTRLTYVGGGRFAADVTLDDSRVFLFSDKYIYFALNDDDALAIRRLTGDRTHVGMPSEGFAAENIRINGGTYTLTVDLAACTWDVDAPVDELKISAFGSSVCNGQGATSFRGYAYQYGQQLATRYAKGLSDNAFWVSGVAIGGNNTQNLLARYDELQHNFSRYVLIGLSLGNEGIHEATDKAAIMRQFSTNMQTLIRRIRAEGKVPVVMNNYTRGDFTLDDDYYIKQMNLLIHQWDVASMNTLGAIDDGSGKWASGYQQDNAHPTHAGHMEFFYAMPPSLFDALQSGKAQPERDRSQVLTLTGGDYLRFRGEGTVHPFTISLRVRGAQAGTLLSYNLGSGARRGSLSVDEEGHVVYTNLQGVATVSAQTLSDDAWHTVTLTHYYAQGRTLLYIDAEEQANLRERLTSLADVKVGDSERPQTSRQFSELLFWRAGMSPEEVQAVADGKMLKSSLEIYVPLTAPEQLHNRAQSMNEVEYVRGVETGVSAPASRTSPAAPYDLFGRPLTRTSHLAFPVISIQGGRKMLCP